MLIPFELAIELIVEVPSNLVAQRVNERLIG